MAGSYTTIALALAPLGLTDDTSGIAILTAPASKEAGSTCVCVCVCVYQTHENTRHPGVGRLLTLHHRAKNRGILLRRGHTKRCTGCVGWTAMETRARTRTRREGIFEFYPGAHTTHYTLLRLESRRPPPPNTKPHLRVRARAHTPTTTCCAANGNAPGEGCYCIFSVWMEKKFCM